MKNAALREIPLKLDLAAKMPLFRKHVSHITTRKKISSTKRYPRSRVVHLRKDLWARYAIVKQTSISMAKPNLKWVFNLILSTSYWCRIITKITTCGRHLMTKKRLLLKSQNYNWISIFWTKTAQKGSHYEDRRQEHELLLPNQLFDSSTLTSSLCLCLSLSFDWHLIVI